MAATERPRCAAGICAGNGEIERAARSRRTRQDTADRQGKTRWQRTRSHREAIRRGATRGGNRLVIGCSDRSAWQRSRGHRHRDVVVGDGNERRGYIDRGIGSAE